MMGTARKNAVFLAFFAALFLVLAFFVQTNSVYAGTGLTIQPIKISHTLKPGEAASGEITLTNASEEAVRVAVKVEDFVPLAGGEGVQFVGRAPGVTTVRDWITLSGKQDFIFPKDQEKKIPYTIRAPANAEPGSHFGVLLFKANKLEEEQLKIGTQVGVLVFVTIPGEFLQKGSIRGFTGRKFINRPPVEFQVQFENTGTVHYEPKGTITITNILGKEVKQIPIAGQVILPTGIKTFSVRWEPTGILLGWYRAVAHIKDGDGKDLTAKSFTFYAFPLWYLAGFLALVTTLFFLIKFLKRRVKISFQ